MAVHRDVEDWLALPLLVFDARVRQVALGNAILEVGLDGSPLRWLVGRPAPGGSRLERLTAQLREEVADPVDLVIGEVLIGSLDEDGYLAQDLGEIAGALAVEREQVERALRIVQDLEPPGIAARTLRESLLLQLRAREPSDPVAIEIVERHFDDLSRHRYTHLARSRGRGHPWPRAEARAGAHRVRSRSGRSRRTGASARGRSGGPSRTPRCRRRVASWRSAP